MDDYAYEIIRRKLELKYPASGVAKLRNCFVCTPLFFRFRMSLKVKNILKLFDELDVEAKAIGLNQVDIARDVVRETYSGHILYGNARSLNQVREHVSGGGDSNVFVGRKGDERKLLEMLCDPFNEDSSLPVVGIVGMGGLGKTTLARRVYDHQNINTLFDDCKIWICVSENFNIIRILNEMVEGVTSNKCDLSNKDGIIRKLEDKLKGKKFLLVLDDVWKEDQVLWDSLRESLKRIGGLPGSMILITTRSKKVVDAARAVYKHELEGLSEADSWTLLKQNVVIDDGSCFEEIGRRIANKCKGVPLSINVIGRLLESKKSSQHDWEVIETSEFWELPQGRNDILPSLLLSFNHLPSPSLKQCFAFCAIFNKGYGITKDILIAYWLAQGFLHILSSETRRLTEEDIGEDIFSILLNHFFFQEFGVDEDGVLLYTMHDLVYDLAVYLSKDLLLIKEENDQQKVSDYRQLKFISVEDQMVSEIYEPKTLRNLRMIFFEGVCSPNWWVHAQYVRTLVLRNCDLSELSPAIELLQHLRYLDLSYNPIRMLPDMICKLYHLQTLRLRGCKRLTDLPSLLNRLVNLRHIFTTTLLYASRGLAELKNLRTLPHLALESDQGWTIDELGALPQLRGEICIYGLEHVKNREQAGEAAVYKHDKVMKMTLTWAKDREETNEGHTDEDVLDGLQPHPAMSCIEVENFYGKVFPSWIMKMAVVTREDIGGRWRPLSNLTILKLLNCSNCQTLPTLGHLPSLSTLIMSGFDVEFIGSEFYGDSVGQVFRSLRKLVISNFPRLAMWMVPTVEVTVVLPCLEHLEVEYCPVLQTIPDLQCESLTHLKLHKLSKIESLDIIKACTKLTSLDICGMSILKRLPDELANCRKLQQLNILDFEQLISLPSLKSMECLKVLTLFCPTLISLPDDFFHGLSALHEVHIYGCTNLRRLPTSFEELTSLKKLFITSNFELENVPLANLSVFRDLWCLDIPSFSAVSLRSMLEAAEQLPKLRTIGVEGFKDEQQLEEYFSDMAHFLRLQSLKTLILYGCSNIRALPEQLGLLTKITILSIWGFIDLEEIPDWLCNLSSLECLIFNRCYSLRSLPSKEAMLRLTRLRCLMIDDCPLLKERYIEDKGPEWHKVKHLSYIQPFVVIEDGSCLEEIGRRIANKCKGVPLSINVIGCLLESKKNSQHDWEVIETTELWELPQGRNDILPSLLLSFNHLPSPSLKQCFAFCAIFTKGWVITKDILIAHWLAQGFLHIPSSETRRLTEEDIGEDIFSILLNHFFFQVEGVDEDGVLWYTIHDLVYDLAVYLSKDLLLIREENDQQKVGDYRHLKFTSVKKQMVSEISEPKTLKDLRTILFEGIYSPNWWVHAWYVRTLMLKNTDLSELPPAIGLLQHLRFLDLSFTPIRVLSDMICILYHLQTLGLRGCKRLTNLPSLLNRLVNLRHIFTTAPLYASRGLGELKNLQTLPHLALESDQGWTIEEIGALPQLKGEICIYGLEHVKNKEQAGKAALCKHDKVMKMTLTWGYDREETNEGHTDEDILDGLQPHPAMSSIEVKNFYGKAFPSWIMKMVVITREDIGGRLRPLSNLTILKLLNCSNCQTLPTLGHLPSLSTLIMSGFDVEFIGSEFYGNSAGEVFRSLTKLVILNFSKLTTWMIPTSEVTIVLPCLESLKVKDCHTCKSKTVPDLQCGSLTHLKLKELSSIESLDIIKACTRLTSLHMCGMSLLTRLPDELANCKKLQQLKIEDFEQLTSLPSLKSMKCLNELTISCEALISLPDDFFHGLSALHDISIYGCADLRRLPTSFEELTSLPKLLITNNVELENVPLVNLSLLRKLWALNISCYSAVSLRSMLEVVEQLPNLSTIGVDGFKDEQQLEEYFSDMTPFLRLQSLKRLALYGCSNITALPEQLGLLTMITTLGITGFEDLDEIPDWLCNLSSLETLHIYQCDSLRSLPSKEAMLRLTRLRCLIIEKCPLLKDSYIKDRGPEWHKVKHLSYIEVDQEQIF